MKTFVVRRPADVPEKAALASLEQRFAGASKIDLEPEWKNGQQMWKATVHMAAEPPFPGGGDELDDPAGPPKEPKEEKAEPDDDEGTSDSSKDAQILSLLKQIADQLGVTQKKHEEKPKANPA